LSLDQATPISYGTDILVISGHLRRDLDLLFDREHVSQCHVALRTGIIFTKCELSQIRIYSRL